MLYGIRYTLVNGQQICCTTVDLLLRENSVFRNINKKNEVFE